MVVFPIERTPSIIPSLAAWYDASNPSGSLGNIIQPANGAAISQWNDLSGRGFHVSQATGSFQPLYSLSFSQPTITFDGTNDRLTTSNSTLRALLGLAKDYTIVAVFRSLVADAVERNIIGSATVAGGTSDILTYQRNRNNYFGLSLYNGTSYTKKIASFSDTSKFHIGYCTNSNLTITSYIDNVVSTVTGDVSTGAAGAFVIGARGDGANSFWSGHISEIIIYSRVLSSNEKTLLSNYTANKYGVSIA